MKAGPTQGGSGWLLALALGVLCVAPSLASADNVGGPIGVLTRSKLGLSLSAGLFQRDVEFDTKLDDYGARDETKVVQTSIRPIVLKAQVSALDWMNPYGVFGLADLRLDETNFEGTMKPFFGGGVVLRLLDSLEAGPDVSLQAHSVYTYNDDYLTGKGVDAKLTYWEIQAALYLHKRISNFIPYMGIGYSDTPFLSEITGKGDVSYRPRSIPIGLLAGLDYFVTPELYLHSELHNFAEDAIILGLGFNL
ncbi:MAG: hypothetical protein HYY13_07965 [Nitrospirae bacterium]|nr:hypothetical protein [Nitrospirota bacterium]